MKKLYRKGTVHPSPPIISDRLSFLPAAILTLTAALSPEDKEVLAYLISCSSCSINLKTSQRTTSLCSTKKNNSCSDPHPPSFNCDCFCCYMNYWARWDASPNRQLIHEIIDAFEDWLLMQAKWNNSKNRRDKRKKGRNGFSNELKAPELSSKDELVVSNSVEESSSSGGGGGDDGGNDEEKGSMRRFVSFIGERIWGLLG